MLLTMSLNCRRWLITLLRSVNWQRRCYKRIIMHPKILKLRRNSWTEAVAVLLCVWTEGEISFWRHWGFIRVPERYGIMIACDVFFLNGSGLMSLGWKALQPMLLTTTEMVQALEVYAVGSLAKRALRSCYFKAHSRLRRREKKI